jgi:hypothetical protein
MVAVWADRVCARHRGNLVPDTSPELNALWKERVRALTGYIYTFDVTLHGGMGVTNEVAAAHLFKRLTIIETTLGDTDHHLARIAALPDFAQADAA